MAEAGADAADIVAEAELQDDIEDEDVPTGPQHEPIILQRECLNSKNFFESTNLN